MEGLPFEMPDEPLPQFIGDADLRAAMSPDEPAPEKKDAEEKEVETSFSPEVHNDVIGMIYLGALTDEYNVWGHKIVLSTLTVGEELAIAQVVKPYNETLALGKAMETATVAGSIETVDGQEPWPRPLGPTSTLGIREKFEWIRDNWHWATVESVYACYADLLLRQQAAFRELEGK